MKDGLERDHRRRFGVFDTPPSLASFVLRLASSRLGRPPGSVLDPAAGTGIFLAEAQKRWPRARTAGFELDPLRREKLGDLGAELLGGDFLAAASTARFDLVVGNPPWVSYSGRHAQPVPDTLPPTKGWRSLHAVFLKRAAEWVAPGGVMSMLAPETVSHQQGYEPLRRELAERGRWEWFSRVPRDGFSGITMPYGVLIWREGARAGTGQARTRPLPPPAHIFADPGVHTGNAAHLLLKPEPGPGRVPLRVGRDVRAFSLAAPSLWLDSSTPLPQRRYARLQEVDRYRSVPILLRQTASKPIAALHVPPHSFRNSVLACTGLEGHEAEYVVGVLNSRVAAVLYRLLNPDARQKVFPQIKVGGLSRLPIARCESGDADLAEPLRLAEHWLGRPLLLLEAQCRPGTSE